MNSTDYKPVYDETVWETLPGQTDASGNAVMGRWPISPFYCLMLPSARLLASLFSTAPQVVLLPPIMQAAGSPFTFNHDVPWLRFEDGTMRNAGQLAIYWGMPGVSDPLAEAKLDVATPVGV